MVGGTELFVGMINNLAILIAMIVVYGLLIDRLGQWSRWRQHVTLGIFFGFISAGCMYAKIPVAEGVLVDQRNAVVVLSGLFGGPVAAVISAFFAGTIRFYLGGAGVFGGIVGVGLAAFAGSIFHYAVSDRQNMRHLAVGSLFAVIAILPGFLFIGDFQRGWALMKGLSIPYGTAAYLGIFIGALLLAREERRRQIEVERERTELARNLALHELQQANKAKSEFMAAMSHELRTPLNAILGFSEMIRSLETLPQEKTRDYAGDIFLSGQHLLDLIDDILDISKIESGNRSIQMETVEVAKIADQCIRSMHQQAEKRGVSIAVEIPESLAVHADERSVRQILLNLLSNAIKYSENGGAVTIDAEIKGGHVHIRVADKGIGIPEDDLPHLGAPFSRANSNPHIATEGTGLGLSIVKSLVALHQGELKITSTEGEGTTVNVVLPIRGGSREVVAAAE